MKETTKKILTQSKKHGWIIEPLAKDLLKSYGMQTTHFAYEKTKDEAIVSAKKIGYPLVAKVVSPEIIHKSDEGGVVVGVKDDKQLNDVFTRFSRMKGFSGILLDAMHTGVELIIGAKKDPQFGMILLIGIGGTGVEIYKDVAIRMAPIKRSSAIEALESLEGFEILNGHRGNTVVNLGKVANLMVKFSQMIIELEDHIESIDLNPIMCNERTAIIADARIMLKHN